MDNRGIVEQVSPVLFRIVLSSALYDKEAVFAAAERFSDRFYIKIEQGNETHVVMLQSRDEDGGGAEKAALQLLNDILDQQVRRHLELRAGALREIIYRHAFLPIEKSDAAS